MAVKICDSIMGSGKTTATLDIINNSDDSKRFLFVTPYLTEVKRVKDTCNKKNFIEPEDMVSKSVNFKYLVKKGLNIVTTHQLFGMIDSETIELLTEMNYTLILDEVMEVITPLQFKKSDQELLLKTGVLIQNEDNTISKGTTEYDGKFNRVVKMAEANRLIRFEDTMFFWDFPVEVFSCFDNVLVLTYMFECQIMKYYFDINNISYEYWHSVLENDSYKLKKGLNKAQDCIIRNNIKSKINIYDGKLNDIGKHKTALSHTWLKKHVTEIKKIKKDDKKPNLKKDIQNYYTNITKANSSNFIWTVFKDCKDNLAGNGYKTDDKHIEHEDGTLSIERGTFCALNVRATNDFSDRTNVVYAVNNFMNPYLVKYFSKNDIEINQDSWGLSEMIQWIWRSAIRNDENINIYVPSKRMRDLLINWLNPDDFEINEIFEDSEEVDPEYYDDIFDLFDSEAIYD